MATSFASDESNNFIIKNGEFVLVEDVDQLVQNVRERLLSYRSDYFLDSTHGLPYIEVIFAKPFNIINAESAIKAEILADSEIEELTSFSSEFDSITRKFTVTVSCTTVYGELNGVTLNV